jgi:hypothetical protein
MLERIWTGIVGGVAGACLGIIITIMLLSTGYSLAAGLWVVAIVGALGAIAGFVFGNKKLAGK